MERRALLLASLAASCLVALATTRAEDEPARPSWVDATTWERVKAQWSTRFAAEADKLQSRSARASLVELERHRRTVATDPDATPVDHLLRDPELTALHAVAFANQTAPRLSGHVVRVGGEEEPASLRVAMPQILPGDTIVLPPGRDVLDLSFRVPRRAPVIQAAVDLAIVGSGVGETRLVVLPRHTQPIQRLRVEHATLDLGSRAFEVTGWWLHLRDCAITTNPNFRGAVFRGDDAVILLEDCTIDGRSASNGAGFALSGSSLLLVRRTRFADVGRLTLGVLDLPAAFEDCTAHGWISNGFSGKALAKNSAALFPDGADVETFARATDDEDVIAAAAGEGPSLDERSARLVGRLGLARSVPYWLGLARDARPNVRALAVARLAKIAGLNFGGAQPPPAEELDAAVRDLDSEQWERRDAATKRLEAAGESVRALLDRTAKAGTAEQKERARALLATLRDREIVGLDAEHARLLRWWENERDRLVWSSTEGRWIPKDFK